MTPAFWFAAAAMLALALAFVLVPLLRARPRSAPAVSDVNLAVLRAQRREIDADVATGALAPEAREQAVDELAERARDDLAPRAEPTPAAGTPWIAVAAVSLALPIVAVGLYAWVGTPEGVDPRISRGGMPLDGREADAIVAKLQRAAQEHPGSAPAWTQLARANAALERFPQAADAYEHASHLAPADAALLMAYADALAMAQGRQLAGKPYELARRVLQMEPDNPRALELAASAALEANDLRASLGYWQRLAPQVAAGSSDAAEVASIVSDIEAKLGEHPAPLASSGPALAGASAPEAITGTVSVAPSIAAAVQPGDILYILARASDGQRMPLAVVRASARDLPMHFALDDSKSMSPQARLSGAAALRIEARLSHTGDARPRPGDLVGTSALVKPGARDITLLIDTVVH
jgi:cytochrome c-type biogenesis protein CcmH